MNNQLFSLFVLISFFYFAIAMEGVVIYDKLYSQSTYECLKARLSAKFAVIRSNSENGEIVESNSFFNVRNAWRGGFEDVDIFFNPCARFECNPSVNVLINVLSYLEDNNVDFDRVWLRIWLHDGKNYQGWSKNKTRNVEIIEKLANTLKEKDRKYGIFTRIDYWLEITENTSKFSDAPLLYYHEDFKNNFDDYYSSGYAFGGWKDPEMKVYGNTKNICGANVYPVWLP